MFEVGQKIKIIDGDSMGMFSKRNGETYLVEWVDRYGDAYLANTTHPEGLSVTPNWIEAGYAEVVE